MFGQAAFCDDLALVLFPMRGRWVTLARQTSRYASQGTEIYNLALWLEDAPSGSSYWVRSIPSDSIIPRSSSPIPHSLCNGDLGNDVIATSLGRDEHRSLGDGRLYLGVSYQFTLKSATNAVETEGSIIS